MHCPHCHQENPPQAKFCLACGLRLRLTCGGCGTELPGQARFCIECGQPTGLPTAGEAAAGEVVAAEAAVAPMVAAQAPPPAGPPVAAGATRVILERDEVLDALYHQGRAALGRGELPAARSALGPVVAEAPERYPDAAARLAEAQRPGSGGPPRAPGRERPAVVADVWRSPGASVDRSGWTDTVRALGAAVALRARRTAASPRLQPLRARLAGHGRWPVGAVGALIGAFILFALLFQRGGPVDTRAASTPDATAVPTVVPDAEVFARCDAAVAASNWTDAVRECRTLQARDPDYAGLDDRLAAAYVGRGQQRLTQAGDLGAASADFEEALHYQPESTEAQTAFQRLYLYQQGDKALAAGDWETAVGQLGANYAEAPEYLQSLADRSLEAKLFAAWLGWGRAALDAGDNLSAFQRCGQALALISEDAEAQSCVDAARTAGGPNESGGD